MYSVVLMAALTTGAGAPDCWFKGGCHGCHGCSGCYGCYGCGGCYGGYGCGGCYGCYGCGGCYGGYGCGCYGGYGYGCYGCGCGGYAAPVYMSPSVPGTPIIPAPGPEAAPKPKEDKTSLSNKARLIVEVPTDAKLYIDDQLMKTPSGRRVFNTPTLDNGQAYYYVVRAEIVRNGQTFTDTKQVVIRAGASIEANFNQLEVTAAAAAAKTQVTASK